jgi:hypothetical protein
MSDHVYSLAQKLPDVKGESIKNRNNGGQQVVIAAMRLAISIVLMLCTYPHFAVSQFQS